MFKVETVSHRNLVALSLFVWYLNVVLVGYDASSQGVEMAIMRIRNNHCLQIQAPKLDYSTWHVKQCLGIFNFTSSESLTWTLNEESRFKALDILVWTYSMSEISERNLPHRIPTDNAKYSKPLNKETTIYH
jgi:hypothetical protein